MWYCHTYWFLQSIYRYVAGNEVHFCVVGIGLLGCNHIVLLPAGEGDCTHGHPGIWPEGVRL